MLLGPSQNREILADECKTPAFVEGAFICFARFL
jgi:hypothetical protein